MTLFINDYNLKEMHLNGIRKAREVLTQGNRMMTSSNENIFCVTDLLWGESACQRWIPLKKASNAELWYFLWCVLEQTAEQAVEILLIWDATALIVTSM